MTLLTIDLVELELEGLRFIFPDTDGLLLHSGRSILQGSNGGKAGRVQL